MEQSQRIETVEGHIVTYGDRVRLKKKGYVGAKGTIRFIGIMESKKGVFYGIELDKKTGRYDGSFLSKQYFECGARKGLFINIDDIDKLVKRAKSMPRVTINSTVLVHKYCNGVVKYIGIPFIQQNKCKKVYYGIELSEPIGKNNGCIGTLRYFACDSKRGVFVKKDGFECIKLTAGGPSQSVSHRLDEDDDIPDERDMIAMPESIKAASSPSLHTMTVSDRKGRKERNKDKELLPIPQTEALPMKRSRSIDAKNKKKLKRKTSAKTFSKSRPNSPELNALNAKKKGQSSPIARKKKAKKFHRKKKSKTSSDLSQTAKSVKHSRSSSNISAKLSTSSTSTAKSSSVCSKKLSVSKRSKALKTKSAKTTPSSSLSSRSRLSSDRLTVSKSKSSGKCKSNSKSRARSATPNDFKRAKLAKHISAETTKEAESEEATLTAQRTSLTTSLSAESASSAALTPIGRDEETPGAETEARNVSGETVRDTPGRGDEEDEEDKEEDDCFSPRSDLSDMSADGEEEEKLRGREEDDVEYLVQRMHSREEMESGREAKGEDDFYDEEEEETDDNQTESVASMYSSEMHSMQHAMNEDEREAAKLMSEALAIKNYRLFVGYIEPIKESVSKLNKQSNSFKAKQKVINQIELQCHDNDLLIWQNILHLALFIVKSMHSFYTLEEKKQTWDFVDFLLQNGGDPLIKMTIKQGERYEHKNIFRLMNEALRTYKQNELLIVKRFTWLWSLVEDRLKFECEKTNERDLFNAILSDDEEYDEDEKSHTLAKRHEERLRKPAILTFDATYSNQWIIADGYDQLPSPKILKEYLDFGCDLVHFCSDDGVYYDFHQIRMSLPPGLLLSTLRVNKEMLFHVDLIGLLVLYYQCYKKQRCDALLELYQSHLVEHCAFPAVRGTCIMQEIIDYTMCEIMYEDDDLQEMDFIGHTLCRIPNYPKEWVEFLTKQYITKFDETAKREFKQISKTWDNDSEWDHYIANLKHKQQFLIFIDAFEYVVGYKTTQKVSNYHLKKNNFNVVQKFMQNEDPFKYLELFNLLYQYDLTRNKSANLIFQKLIDLTLNRKKSDRKHAARKELNKLYVQFCRHEVDDAFFHKNLLFILKQLLPENSRKSGRKKSKKSYRFDFAQAILHCFKAGTLNTLEFLITNRLLTDVERALRLFYVDDVIKRIIFGMDEFDEKQEDFLRLILNWTWQYAQNKEDMQTWYVKWLEDSKLVEDEDCIEIFQSYCNLSDDTV